MSEYGASGQNVVGRVVHLTISAKPEYIILSRLALSGFARVREFSEDILFDFKLAFMEVCSNFVRHVYGNGEGHVDISFELFDDRLIVEVVDDGFGFEPFAGERAFEEELMEGGLGIAIICSIVDEVEFGDGTGGWGSRLRFVKLF